MVTEYVTWRFFRVFYLKQIFQFVIKKRIKKNYTQFEQRTNCEGFESFNRQK